MKPVEGAARASGLPPGTRLGRYTLLRRLAVGGMAELYIAHQGGARGFSKFVALKRILPHLAEDPTFTKMFLDEARLAAGLDHPNLAHVLDSGEHDSEHFLTMEYVHGRNLLQLLRAQGDERLPLASALSIVALVARGLHDLHEQCAPDGRPLGLVHRDVSPSNVLVSFEGQVKLTDFGIAKAMELTSATQTSAFKGKLGHSSPEQVRGEQIDRRSDVFCLGILLYETTTGVRAFSGPNQFAVLGKVARGQFVPLSDVVPQYPAGLARVVERALRTDPSERYPSAAAFADAVELFAGRAGLQLSTEAVAMSMFGAFGEAPPIVDANELELAQQSGAALSTSSAPALPHDALPAPRSRQLGLLFAIPLALVAGASLTWAFTPRAQQPPAPVLEAGGVADAVQETSSANAEEGAAAPAVLVGAPPSPAMPDPPTNVPESASAAPMANPSVVPAGATSKSAEAEDAEALSGTAVGRKRRPTKGRRSAMHKEPATAPPQTDDGLGGLYPPQ